jgi:hypothetical protein
MRYMLTLAAALALALLAAPAFAEEYVPEEGAKGQDQPEGEAKWDFTLSIGASGNLSQNTSVIGQPDGSSYTLGGKLEFGADYISASHEVRNDFLIVNTFTRTPVIPEFVRSADTLRLETIYYYHLEKLPWVGPFARLQLETSLFKGINLQPSEVTYETRTPEGDLVETRQSDRQELTDSFRPLKFKESVGAFARPVSSKVFDVELRLGIGSQQIFADGGLALADNEDTTPIEIVQLEDSVQAGGEFVTTIGGAIFGKRLTYNTGLEVLVPFYNSGGQQDNRGPIDLANIEVYARASLKVVEWASLDYEFRAVRQPLLLDEFQIQNNLLLTFGYTLLDSDE